MLKSNTTLVASLAVLLTSTSVSGQTPTAPVVGITSAEIEAVLKHTGPALVFDDYP